MQNHFATKYHETSTQMTRKTLEQNFHVNASKNPAQKQSKKLYRLIRLPHDLKLGNKSSINQTTWKGTRRLQGFKLPKGFTTPVAGDKPSGYLGSREHPGSLAAKKWKELRIRVVDF